MKRMIGQLKAMYNDVYGLSGANTSEMDMLYVTRRVEKEGISFLTITLPALSGALLEALEEGRWPHAQVTSFRCDKGKTLPRLFSGLFRLIFDMETGVLLPDANVTAIWGIYQLCSSFKKIELECSPERVKKAYEKYLATDTEVRETRRIASCDRLALQEVFNTLYANALQSVEESIFYGRLRPRYSSGSVAEGYSENQKFSAPFYQRLGYLFHPDWYLVPNLSGTGELSGREFVAIGHETPAKVTHVPKTLKTPRLIAMEPTCIQYAQQALMREFYDEILRSEAGKSLNFRDQTVNGQRALRGSVDRSLATIDLSEASDRVGSGLVSRLFKNFPLTREFLFRARSSRVSLPDGKTVRLKKFASMGSAMCFPVEAMVFHAIATYGIVLAERKGWSSSRIKRVGASVTVFGDDIIVPNRHAPTVTLALDYFGLKVNSKKTFHKGFFRESCGVDAYKGQVITPIYARKPLPKSPRDVPEILANVAYSNLLFRNGMWNASDYVRREVERVIKMRLPIVAHNSGALGLTHPWSQYYDTHRYCRDLQSPRVRTLVLSTGRRLRHLGGVESTVKSLLRLEESHGVPSIPLQVDNGDGTLGEMHSMSAKSFCSGIQAIQRGNHPLDSEVRRHALRLKRGWASPY